MAPHIVPRGAMREKFPSNHLGGPDLLGGTDTILVVNSYVTNGNCAGVTYSNRIETYALDFINSFLP
jgi:hypothetical protein